MNQVNGRIPFVVGRSDLLSKTFLYREFSKYKPGEWRKISRLVVQVVYKLLDKNKETFLYESI